MRVAIILVGHLRTWKMCKKSFIDTFAKYNPDIYVYTYNTINYESTKVSDSEIIDHFKDIDIKNIVIKNENDVLEESNIKYSKYYIQNSNTKLNTFTNFLCQYINIKKCYDIIKDTNIEYDFVIKTRPDISYNFDSADIFTNECLISNKIYTSNRHFTCDYFAISSTNNMRKYCNTINKLEDCYNWCFPDVEITPHMLLHFSISAGYTNHLDVTKIS